MDIRTMFRKQSTKVSPIRSYDQEALLESFKYNGGDNKNDSVSGSGGSSSDDVIDNTMKSSYESKPKPFKSPMKKKSYDVYDRERYESLNDTQRSIFDGYRSGMNMFITGPGGSGKSYLIKTIVDDAINLDKRIAVTAMTGCAAVLLNCNAKTLHTWGGLGIVKGDVFTVVNRVAGNKYKKKNWKNTDILIVDEVSMMSKKMFNILNAVAQRVRNDSRPFGGMQVIFSGDFYQLPPVSNTNDIDAHPDDGAFCFQSEEWNDVFPIQVLMSQIYRQKDDTYRKILQGIRLGRLEPHMIETLKSRVDIPHEDRIGDVRPVRLLPVRSKVDVVNNMELDAIRCPERQYKYSIERKVQTGAKTSKPPSKQQLEFAVATALKQGRFERVLRLKEGAQVMCTMNLDLERQICNGTTGIVKTLTDRHVTVELSSGQEYTFGVHEWESDIIEGLVFKQIPLVLAYALTIHKSQGATLESAVIDAGSDIFAAGQTYVAMSRVKSIDGLYLDSFDPRRVKVDKRVIQFYSNLG